MQTSVRAHNTYVYWLSPYNSFFTHLNFITDKQHKTVRLVYSPNNSDKQVNKLAKKLTSFYVNNCSFSTTPDHFVTCLNHYGRLHSSPFLSNTSCETRSGCFTRTSSQICACICTGKLEVVKIVSVSQLDISSPEESKSTQLLVS